MTRVPWDAVAVALVAWLGVGGAWMWRDTVLERDRAAKSTEPWQQVRTRYPMPEAFHLEPEPSTALLQAVVQANPFSSERRAAKLSLSDDQSAPPPPVVPPKPQFIFKGRVIMGAVQRAIVEDNTIKKTYFLQVGQEVAGFKVLDIQETRVILSDLKTNEELTLSLTVTKTR